jgi:hypothetical protein
VLCLGRSIHKMANEGTNDYSPDPKKIEEWERFSKVINAAKQRDEKGIVELTLTPAMQETGIVERFNFYPKTSGIMLVINHIYDRKLVVFNVNTKNWDFTSKNFKNKLKEKGITNKDHVKLLTEVLDNNYQEILSLHQQHKQEKEKEKQIDEDKDKDNDKPQKHKRRHATYKYSAKGANNLHEAIILAGQPAFIIYDNENHKIEAFQNVEEATRILKPPNSEEYPYDPYDFANVDELKSYMERAVNESIDSLYQKAKSIVRKYNDQDEHKLILLAADIIWSYFQDKFSTTHYIAIVGGNGSGKTTIGDTFAAVGYRTVTMTDPSAANIFRVLGRIEYGQCTIVMDEAEKIDKSPDTMNVLKSGYQFNARISKINMNEEVQQWFFPYCLKFIIAERSPSQSDAKGVLDRTFLYTAYKGKPPYDIKEVLNPAGNERRQRLLDELVDFRKLMLIYRIVHFQDPILDIDIGLDGRDKELCKPLLQLFNETESHAQIRSALKEFLDAKNQKKSNLIEAALHPIIVNLVSALGEKVYSSDIWNRIKAGAIEGYYDEKKPNVYESADYGTIYRNTITSIICDKFGAEKRHTEKGSILKFDAKKLARIGWAYNIESHIQTKLEPDSPDSPDGSIELQGHHKQDDDVKNEDNDLNNTSTNHVDNTSQIENKQPIASQEPSAPSEPSANDPPAIEQQTPDSIYRIGHSDLFACNNCNVKGDKWFMLTHPEYCKARNNQTKPG